MQKYHRNHHFLSMQPNSITQKGTQQTENNQQSTSQHQLTTPTTVNHKTTYKSDNCLQQTQIVCVVQRLLLIHNVLENLLGVVYDRIYPRQLVSSHQDQTHHQHPLRSTTTQSHPKASTLILPLGSMHTLSFKLPQFFKILNSPILIKHFHILLQNRLLISPNMFFKSVKSICWDDYLKNERHNILSKQQ